MFIFFTSHFRISLGRWPQDNFDLMIKIMQTAVKEGKSVLNLIENAVVATTKHSKTRAKQEVKSSKKAQVCWFSLLLSSCTDAFHLRFLQ